MDRRTDTLTLINAKLTDEALQALSKLETVEELHLNDCRLTDERLKHLGVPPKLSTLFLSRNEIAGPGLNHLVKLKLQKLSLDFNEISDKTLVHIPQLTSVEQLGISYNRGVTNAGIRSGTLQSMSNLKQLNLRGLTQIDDDVLDDLVKLSHLEHIGIRETKISSAGVAKLKEAMPKTTVFK